MWGKNEEGQNLPARPTNAPTTTTAPAAPPVTRATESSRATIFGQSMKIVGDVSSDEEMVVDGDLEGTLVLRNRLTIGPTGKVKANIKAQDVVVFGSVRGNIEAEQRISMKNGASVVGDVKTAGIVIEDGAYFKGGIDISRTDTVKNGQTQQQSKAAGGKH